VEVTVNGLGERAGNAAVEEVVMALKTRKDYYGVTTGVNTKRIVPVSKLTARLTGMSVQRNKAIVGENAFAHEAGIHVHGVLCHRETYEIMRPQDVGIDESKIVLGKHTGHHAVASRVKALGYHLNSGQLEEVMHSVKRLADRKKNVYDADLEAILRDNVGQVEQTFSLERFQVMTGKELMPVATVTLKTGDEEKTDASVGDGPVDAILTAIDRITGMSGHLKDYRIDAVTGGREALGEVHITVLFDGEEFTGRGASPDVLEASALAYIHTVNRVAARAKGIKRGGSSKSRRGK
jgi:2-isopropylmalate synthase